MEPCKLGCVSWGGFLAADQADEEPKLAFAVALFLEVGSNHRN